MSAVKESKVDGVAPSVDDAAEKPTADETAPAAGEETKKQKKPKPNNKKLRQGTKYEQGTFEAF